MKLVNPFVAVDNCKEELVYYQQVLGGEARILRKQGDAVLNAELLLGDSKITFADARAAKPTRKGDYVKLMLRAETEAEFHRVYGELTAGGQTDIKPYEAPFNGLLAVATDRNGIGWVLAFYRD